jgi:hypothetical protein
MSFLAASGSAGGSGHTPPTPPTTFTLSRVVRDNGTSPQFQISSASGGTFANKNLVSFSYPYSARLYRTSDNVLIQTVALTPTATTSTTITAGTSYYVKLTSTDIVTQQVSIESSASAAQIALTKPANMGTITASNGVGVLNTSWTAVNAGGDSSVTYSMILYQSANSGSSYSQAATATTTNTSYAWTGLTGGSTYYYYVQITPSNTLGSSNSAVSGTINVTSAAPPPPPPPPPAFGPFFPPFFGPYFCLQADSPVLVWVDGKTLKRKVKDLQIGDKVVSYTFAELPENDSEYSLNSWNSQSMTPLEIKEATVVMNEKMITQSTVFFNEDQNNRMSLEHLVFVKRSGLYSIVLAGLVEIGDTILKIDEETLTIYEDVISSIEHINEQTEIYKLDVTPYDIFFGGNILTHNKGPVFY